MQMWTDLMWGSRLGFRGRGLELVLAAETVHVYILIALGLLLLDSFSSYDA